MDFPPEVIDNSTVSPVFSAAMVTVPPALDRLSSPPLGMVTLATGVETVRLASVLVPICPTVVAGIDTSALLMLLLNSGAIITLSLLFCSACFTISLPMVEFIVTVAVSPFVVAVGLAVVAVVLPPSWVPVVTDGVPGALGVEGT